MAQESILKKIKDFFVNQLFKINDTPQKIALGAGLGVFAGLLPGTGPAAALCLAIIFRANRAAALLGSLLTNTWLSFLTFILAIKVGAAVLGMNWRAVYENTHALTHNFSWQRFFKFSFSEIILPLGLGYLIIGLIFGICSYLIIYYIIKRKFKA